MQVLVVAATGRELRAALSLVGFGGEIPEQGRALELKLSGTSAILLVTGVGLVNAALALGRALARNAPDLVLNLGVCGSFDLSRAPLGSRVLVRREIWPEYGLLGPGNPVAADPRGIGLAQGRMGDAEIWDRVDLAGPEALVRAGLGVPRDLIQGASLSVAGVTGTCERAEALLRAYGAPAENPAGVPAENPAGVPAENPVGMLAENPAGVLAENPASVLAENMEGFSLAYGCAQQNVPLVELRTVSNQVGERGKHSWDMKGALMALGRMAAEIFIPAK